MFGDDTGSKLYTNKCFDFPDVRYTEDSLRPYPCYILVGWVGVCALRCPRPCPCAGTESTLLCLRKPCSRYSGIRLGLSAIYHRVGREGKRKRREEEKKGCAICTSITTWKSCLSYTAADILLSRKLNVSFHWKNLKEWQVQVSADVRQHSDVIE